MLFLSPSGRNNRLLNWIPQHFLFATLSSHTISKVIDWKGNSEHVTLFPKSSLAFHHSWANVPNTLHDIRPACLSRLSEHQAPSASQCATLIASSQVIQTSFAQHISSCCFLCLKAPDSAWSGHPSLFSSKVDLSRLPSLTPGQGRPPCYIFSENPVLILHSIGACNQSIIFVLI